MVNVHQIKSESSSVNVALGFILELFKKFYIRQYVVLTYRGSMYEKVLSQCSFSENIEFIYADDFTRNSKKINHTKLREILDTYKYRKCGIIIDDITKIFGMIDQGYRSKDGRLGGRLQDMIMTLVHSTKDIFMAYDKETLRNIPMGRLTTAKRSQFSDAHCKTRDVYQSIVWELMNNNNKLMWIDTELHFIEELGITKEVYVVPEDTMYCTLELDIFEQIIMRLQNQETATTAVGECCTIGDLNKELDTIELNPSDFLPSEEEITPLIDPRIDMLMTYFYDHLEDKRPKYDGMIDSSPGLTTIRDKYKIPNDILLFTVMSRVMSQVGFYKHYDFDKLKEWKLDDIADSNGYCTQAVFDYHTKEKIAEYCVDIFYDDCIFNTIKNLPAITYECISNRYL